MKRLIKNDFISESVGTSGNGISMVIFFVTAK